MRKTYTLLCLALAMTLVASACGDSKDSSGNDSPTIDVEAEVEIEIEVEVEVEPEVEIEVEVEVECEVEFETTFEAVQKIFDDNCVGCHAENGSGGLDLRGEVAHENIFEVQASASNNWLVYPGDTERSFLYEKIIAWNEPSSTISGGPMPPGAALGDTELDLVRFWIYSGAPKDIMVQGTEEILEGACLAPAQAFVIEPLDPPASEDGVQISMPLAVLAKASETETCVAVYEDFCDQIPDEYRVPDSNFFMYDGNEIRMPPFSHHLLIQAPVDTLRGEEVDPNDFTDWTCQGGERHGVSCDPLAKSFCGTGRCATPIEGSTACIGYGPAKGINMATFAGTQEPQAYNKNYPGVYSFAPCRSIVAYNLHAFNLTLEDATMTAQVNFEFAKERKWRARRITTDGGSGLGSFGIGRLIQEGAEAYSENTLCTDVTLPQNALLTGAASHTHRLGARSWWTDAQGKVFYESLIYNDPTVLKYAEPILYDDPDPATRTFRFCTLYRNGIDADGNLDPERMSRASRIPYTFGGPDNPDPGCEAYRCVNESVDRLSIDCDDGIANGTGDHSMCDSSPGANDGFCDGCSILGGITTQNEMYQGSLNFFIMD